MKIKYRIPTILIFLRLLLGPVLITLVLLDIPNYSFFAVFILSTGLLSDVFDGIIARKLGCSTEKLRRLDSSVDQVFFLSVFAATYIQCPTFFNNHWISLIILLSIETSTYIYSYLKFKREVATHSIGAKIWTLFLFATLLEIMLSCQSSILFTICIWLGILTRLEILAILITLKKWTNDVPSIYHAVQIRKGKQIKKNKLFNG